MTDQKASPSVDPAVQAARITRTGAIIGVVLAALITGTATGLAAYFSGRKDGERAATQLAPPSTVTVTVAAGPPATPDRSVTATTAPGTASLFTLNPVEQSGQLALGRQEVNAKTYDQVVTGQVSECGYEGPPSRTYQLSRKYSRLQSKVGITDSSHSGSLVEFRVLIDGKLLEKATTRVQLGAIETIDVDITGAFRVQLLAVWPRDEGSSCRGEWKAGAAWIEPTIS